MARAGLKYLYCRNCKTLREVEVGIREMYCCAKLMDEVEEDSDTKEMVLRKTGQPIEIKQRY